MSSARDRARKPISANGGLGRSENKSRAPDRGRKTGQKENEKLPTRGIRDGRVDVRSQKRNDSSCETRNRVSLKREKVRVRFEGEEKVEILRKVRGAEGDEKGRSRKMHGPVRENEFSRASRSRIHDGARSGRRTDDRIDSSSESSKGKYRSKNSSVVQNQGLHFGRTQKRLRTLNTNGDSEKPKRKRKIIRIDPYDISNKRLDDGISVTENIKEIEEEEVKKKSKNAEFRAIHPNPSILSFVENNVLGRRRLIDMKRLGYNTDIPSPLDNIPHSKRLERESIEEPVFRNKLAFFAAAKISSSFPPSGAPEIAFAGRSNVGKSSLMNSLTRQWGTVRTSGKPGLTQTINFFQLGSKLCLVDLPGYGFAYAKDEVKDAWEELVKEYVSTRVGLKRVCLLIDTKWGMKPRDSELVNLMERSKTKYQLVLTKTDLVHPVDVARRAMQIQENLKGNKSVVQPMMMVSSKSGAGIRTLRTILAGVSRFAKL